MTFAVGIITAPRDPSYLGLSLDSFFDEWHATPTVFTVDMDVKYTNRYNTYRQRGLPGHKPNWMRCLRQLPDADWSIICEDDIFWREGSGTILRRYLAVVDPRGVGFVSPYCSRYNGKDRIPCWHAISQREAWCGALCVCIPRHTRQLILECDFPSEKGLDVDLGDFIFHNNLTIHTYVPTLIMHLGDKDESSFFHKSAREPML